MRRRILHALAIIAVLCSADFGRAQTPPPARCDVPADLLHVDDPLPVMAKHLKAAKPVRIVAIGGASTAGDAAGSRDLAYPQRLQKALSERWPNIAFEVVNKGVARQSAREMIKRFESDVLAESPALVIWEVGINDAVRGVDVDEFSQTLQAGIDGLKGKRIDVIVMDMQYSRGSATIIGFDPYLQAIHRIADINDVIWFPRYDIMRHWSQTGTFDFTNVRGEERRAMAAKVYDCIARNLVEVIERAAR